MRPEDAGLEPARLPATLRPDELSLLGWVRPRVDAAMVEDIAVLDYGMHVQEYRDSIEDLMGVRRLPEQQPWTPGPVLQPASNRQPAPDDERGHVARLFACLVTVCTDDIVWPAGTLAGLVESALTLGPEPTAAALRFVAWCRLHRPGAWRDDPQAQPFLTLGLLLLYAAARDDPPGEAALRDAFVAEVEAEIGAAGSWRQVFKHAADGDRRETWRILVAAYLTGRDQHDDAAETMRTWFRPLPRDAAHRGGAGLAERYRRGPEALSR